MSIAATAEGLSPRMRGSHVVDSHALGYVGPIPAHAGEPARHRSHQIVIGAYPRACGGACGHGHLRIKTCGLSPRMRGSHADRVAIGHPSRPIPAHAGEPAEVHVYRRAAGAYPRACGGADTPVRCASSDWGLSPRMRGSLSEEPGNEIRTRPIPAHAGEPGTDQRGAGRHRAYPRACGGARAACSMRTIRYGLSPRMRGSRAALPRPDVRIRPIPAHAGEPARTARPISCLGAYPRACGGAPRAQGRQLPCQGLSPRMRGSPLPSPELLGDRGPIPAHAGEPRDFVAGHLAQTAYPRACGGATL